jgi:hypothetical protein
MGAVDGALAQAEKGRTNLLAVLEQGLLPATEVAEALGRVKARLGELTGRRRELEARLAAEQGGAVATAEAAAFLSQLREGGWPMADRKRLVRELLAGVSVDGRRVEVRARWPELG